MSNKYKKAGADVRLLGYLLDHQDRVPEDLDPSIFGDQKSWGFAAGYALSLGARSTPSDGDKQFADVLIARGFIAEHEAAELLSTVREARLLVEPDDTYEGIMAELHLDGEDLPLDPHDPGPIPAEYLNVPGIIGKVMAYNKRVAHTDQPVLALAGAIALQAVLAGRKVRDSRGNRTNLYAIGVAKTGTGKEAARSINKRILSMIDSEAHNHLLGAEDWASDSGLLAQLATYPCRLFQIDELGRVLVSTQDGAASHLYGIRTQLLRLYSSADSVFLGKAYADEARNLKIDYPCCVLYGTTTPDVLYHSMGAGSVADGFVPRLLMFEGLDDPDRLSGEETDPPRDLLDACSAWARYSPGGNLGEAIGVPALVKYEPAATRAMMALSDQIRVAMKGAPDAHRASLARCEQHAARLALVHACSRASEPCKTIVDGADAEWACGLAWHLCRRAIHLAHAWVADGKADANSKAVIRAIVSCGGKATTSQLCRNTRGMSVRDRNDAIRDLLECRRIHETEVRTKTKPSHLYTLCK